MANEVVQSIVQTGTTGKLIATFKNSPAGTIVGGISGYLVAKKMIKTEKWWATALCVFGGMIIGSATEHKIKHPKGLPEPKTE